MSWCGTALADVGRLGNAHALRELIYVIDTAPPAVADLAAQGAEAMVAVKDLVDA